jgi:hypothetical protein
MKTINDDAQLMLELIREHPGGRMTDEQIKKKCPSTDPKRIANALPFAPTQQINRFRSRDSW